MAQLKKKLKNFNQNLKKKPSKKISFANNLDKLLYCIKTQNLKALVLIMNLTYNNFFINISSLKKSKEKLLIRFSTGTVVFSPKLRGRRMRLRREFIIDTIKYFYHLISQTKLPVLLRFKRRYSFFVGPALTLSKIFNLELLGLEFYDKQPFNGCRPKKKKSK